MFQGHKVLPKAHSVKKLVSNGIEAEIAYVIVPRKL